MLGNIIFGRTQAARGENYICTRECLIQCFEYMFTIIMYGGNLIQFNPRLIEALCHPCRVGIYHLPNQQFIAYGNDFCFHSLPLIYNL